MNIPFYHSSLALLTDLYQLTMAYGYWKLGIHDRHAAFHLSFRRKPFQGSYAIMAGLETLIEFIKNFKYNESDLEYLSSLKNSAGNPLFEGAFLDYLKDLEFTCDLDAVVEGTPIFPYEPLLRVKGPILQAQLLESPLLNLINFQTLIATKASRICQAAYPSEVVEFGLRRAQGPDGSLSGTRASYVGGCHSTSSVIAGKHFGIPVKGTHAHSWIMAFSDEEKAFEAYAKVLPDDCVFLIDTYDTRKGTQRAINVAKKLKNKALGVRLDSGDLAHLSIDVRRMLDAAGLSKMKIMASNELDENIIRDLMQQGAKIDIWGVGTNLITGKDQPALDGVYKLSGITDENGKWIYKLKISEQIIKTTNPGILQIRRYFDENGYLFDMMYDTQLGASENGLIIDPLDQSSRREIKRDIKSLDLLIPIFEKGECIYKSPSLHEMRENTLSELSKFHPAVRRFLHPDPYFVGLENKLYDLKMSLIRDLKNER